MEKLIELERAEAQNINGGGPTWNVTGKLLGAILDLIEDISNSYSSTQEGHAVQQALLDFH